MRINQCLFCTSRRCYTRIVSINDFGKTYDEVACRKHSEMLYKHSDEIAQGVMKMYESSTGCLSRGTDITLAIKELQEFGAIF